MLPVKSTISFEWRLQGTRIIDKLPPNEKYRTCCNCCHIRTGTLFLGLVELVAVAFLFVNIVKQLMWKHNDRALCAPGELLKDCLIFNFSHFNVTLAGDYVVALLMISIMLSIVLLFYGIVTVRPGFLFPHIIVQAFGLICSLTYFFLYAWSYFYGDLHTQQKSFKFEALVERMWLASIVLIFSAFQCYLFLTVIKCTLFLSKLSDEHKRRKSQFQEVSDRVKLAKENGLWDTSWGGTFQQYRGENDESEEAKRNQKRKDKPVNRVQWDLQKNEEKSISMCPEDSSSEHCRTKHKTVVELHKEPKKSAIKTANVSLSAVQKGSTESATSEKSKDPLKAPESPQRQHRQHRRPRTATAEDRSPTRLHKTDSSDSARGRRRERDLSGSPTTKKKRPSGVPADAMQAANVGSSGGSAVSESSPKQHHRQRREREREHRSREEHHGRVSPSKPMPTSVSAVPVVKKVSISSSNPLAFPTNGFVS
uniref:MARVEL domain-containing protein n=1 Tax=Panagrellus redivivus TaxID=6233 RepID=A0A7E4ZT20_PANRE